MGNGQPTMNQEAADPMSIKCHVLNSLRTIVFLPKYRKCNATQGTHCNNVTLHFYVILSFRAKRRSVRRWLCYLEFFETVTEQGTAEQAGAVCFKVSSP